LSQLDGAGEGERSKIAGRRLHHRHHHVGMRRRVAVAEDAVDLPGGRTAAE
jgi:hypothetical protein